MIVRPSRRARLPRHRAGLRVTAVALIVAASSLAFAPTQAASAAGTGAVSKSKTVSRVFLDNGRTTTVDKRTVHISVSQTENLRSLQLIHVSWSGAHPTGGIVADQNSDLAQNEEYPMVLLECRGVDSTKVPAAKQLSPDTCWTQYADERFSYGYSTTPEWRSDLYAAPKDRAAVVGAPKKLNTQCRTTLLGTDNQRWVPFDAADGTVYEGGPFGCAGLAPEASPANSSSLALPSNETFGVTHANGKGEADFDVFTAEDHASLGCSQTVACSLVAVPVEGISCDPAGARAGKYDKLDAADVATAKANCEAKGNFTPDEPLPNQGAGAPAVDGSLWWSASNWRNRITIPLTFAPSDDACGLASKQHAVNVYGSELMIQATTQWAPTFCLNSKLFDFTHVQTPEPQARSLLATGNVEAAFGSDAPTTKYPEPTVNAPTSVTGFGIAFDVDDNDKHEVTTLRLDPRLLAKLLTESYPDQIYVQQAEPADNPLSTNPLNITDDPEFQALNPNIPTSILDAKSTLLTVNTDSDVMQALTSYIMADPAARAFMNGEADPWGMKVNPAYNLKTNKSGFSLPTDNWPLLDSTEPTDEYQPGRNDCLFADPVPFLPLVAAPTARLFNIGQDMEFALSQSQTVCVLPSPIPGSLAGAKLVATGRQAIGSRFMLGVVSLGDAAREGLHLAQLQTTSSLSPDDKFTSAAGQTFVGPSDASLKAAAQTLTFDSGTGMWPVDYAALRKHASAYPGTMVVYTSVPLKNLPSQDAKDYAKLLTFFAGPGQHPGTGQGDLPSGYLPMTSANGLGAMVAYTTKAAKAVAAQQGTLHPTVVSPPPSSGSSGPSGSSHSSGNSGATQPIPPITVPGGGATSSGTPAPSGTSSSSGTGTSVAPTSSAPTSLSASPAAARTPEVGAGLGGAALPILLGLGLIAGIAAAVTRIRGAREGR